MSKTLAERLQLVQGHQRRMLADQKERLTAQQQPKSQDGGQDLADGQDGPPKVKPVIDEHGRIDASLLFERLLVPITSHMACSPEDVAWIRENWSTGPDLVPTLLDWAAKVSLEGVVVEEEARTAAALLHKQGSGALRLERKEAAPAAAVEKPAPQMSRGAMRP